MKRTFTFLLIGFVACFLTYTNLANAQSNNLVENVGIGSTAPGQALDVQGTVRSTAFNVNGYKGFLGSWVSESGNTVYQASTDVFVLCSVNATGLDGASIYTDGNNPPTTQRGLSQVNNSASTAYGLVRKNDYWECEHTGGGGSITFNWIYTTAIGS